MHPGLGWLAERSTEAVVAAVEQLGVRLAAEPVLSPHFGDAAPPWRRSTAVAGDVVIKFAWSRPAAEKLFHEALVLQVLGSQPEVQDRVPVVEAVGSDPVVLVTRRLRGGPISYPDVSAMGDTETDALASQLAAFLAGLHSAATYESAERAVPTLRDPEPQSTTDGLRARLPKFIDDVRAATVARWCDWADAVLADAVEPVLLHGDFGGHNWLWDPSDRCVVAVVDFEESAVGDPHYDLRYFPSQADSLQLLRATSRHYEANTGRSIAIDRVMAWHLRTSLGDALWRSEAGVPLPFGGTPSEWVDEFATGLAEAGLTV
jgi:aminoglycoside phosphotransferase (APT) family kinase protein